jgi:hypothetical protein
MSTLICQQYNKRYTDNVQRVCYTKDEDMLLTEEDTYSANDVEMLSAEESDAHLRSFSSVNRRDNIEKWEDSLVPLRTFMDVDPVEIKDEGIPIDTRSFLWNRTKMLQRNLKPEDLTDDTLARIIHR